MSDMSEQKRGPGRPPRQQEVQQQRRRRTEMGEERLLKLGVPDELKEPGFEHRWINDDIGRIESKTVHDDWDVVKTPGLGDGEGTPVKRPVGTGPDGRPLYAYLCRKPKQFFDEDKRKQFAAIKAVEDGLKRGDVKGGDALEGSRAYVPGGRDGMSGRNVIEQG